MPRPLELTGITAHTQKHFTSSDKTQNCMKEHIVLRNNSAFCTSVGFWKGLRRSEPRGDSGGSGWRKEAVKNVEKCESQK